MAKSVYLDPVTGEPDDTATQAAPAPAAAPADPTARTVDPSAPAPLPTPAATVPPGNISTQPVIPPGIPAGQRMVDPGPGPAAATASLDPATVVADWMAHNNPQGHTDPAYWLRRFTETGGLRADNLEYWKGRFMEAPGTHVEGGGGAPTAPSAGGNGLDPSISDFFRTQTASLAAQQQRDAEIRAIIRTRLASAQQPVDENAAEVTQPLSAARDEVTRSQDAERTAVAERLYAQGGLNTGALQQQIAQSSERNAGGLSSLRAGLITHLADAKRQELQQLLQLATAQGDAESARAIQGQISALNASVTSSGQGIQLAEFLAQLNQNSAVFGLNG